MTRGEMGLLLDEQSSPGCQNLKTLKITEAYLEFSVHTEMQGVNPKVSWVATVDLGMEHMSLGHTVQGARKVASGSTSHKQQSPYLLWGFGWPCLMLVHSTLLLICKTPGIAEMNLMFPIIPNIPITFCMFCHTMYLSQLRDNFRFRVNVR